MRWRIHKRKSYYFVILALVIFLITAHAWYLPKLGEFLVLDNFQGNADLAIVLAGQIPDRAMEAAMLYREGRVARILLSRSQESLAFQKLHDMGIEVADEFTTNMQILQGMHVPQDKIIMAPSRYSSTNAEAQAFAALPLDIHSLVIVTSATHSHRAYLSFRQHFDSHLIVMAKPSRFDDFPIKHWWRHRIFIKQVVSEYEKHLIRLLHI